MPGAALPTTGSRKHLLVFMHAPDDSDLINKKADEYLQSRFQFYAYDPVFLPVPLTWDENPYCDVSWTWRLHVMRYVFVLTRAYEFTGELSYLCHAEQLVLNWIDVNVTEDWVATFGKAWDQHATALRLTHWLYFVDAWKASTLCTAKKIQVIDCAVNTHAKRLAEKSFYTPRHNHGIDQDRALLAFSLMHPGAENAKAWTELSLGRLQVQLRLAMSENGIHLEHSPSYHLVGMVQMSQLLRFLRSWDVTHAVVDELSEGLSSMVQFVEHAVKPDGVLAAIGDGTAEPVTAYKSTLLPLAKEHPVLEQLANTGTTSKLGNTATAYPQEGYVILRDFDRGKLPFDQSLFLFFTAAANKGYDHGHADGLSFILSHAGRDILIDHGYYSYREDKGRNFVVGTRSHNTLCVNKQSYEGWDTGIETFKSGDTWNLLRASHRNYNFVEHTRWLILLRPDIIIVVDRASQTDPTTNGGKEKTVFEQLFHLAPDLQAVTDTDSLSFQIIDVSDKDSYPVMRMVQLAVSSIPPAISLSRGETRPMLGWTSKEHAELIPSPTIVSTIFADEAFFVTAIDLSSNTHSWGVRPLLPEHEVFVISWTRDSEIFALHLDLRNNDLQLVQE